MDFGILVPIAAIIVWGGGNALKRYIDYRENVALRLQQQSTAVNQNVMLELEALRREVAALRDTSTQYDLSIDHHLRELDQRLQSVERRTSYTSAPSTADIDVQKVIANT